MPNDFVGPVYGFSGLTDGITEPPRDRFGVP